MKRATVFTIVVFCFQSVATAAPDPWLWLEPTDSAKALHWVQRENSRAQGELEKRPEFAALLARIKAIINSKQRLAYPRLRGDYIYNFWRDHDHVRGIWRRTPVAQYVQKKPNWETLIDLDKLTANEGENWVWKGSNCLYPEYRHCMIKLSRGGADASLQREFDTHAKAFVADGFTLPEAKSSVRWVDADTLFVGTTFKGQDALTQSGYPNIVKIWKRGTPIAQASTVFKGQASDVSSSAYREFDGQHHYDFIERSLTFYKSRLWLRRGKGLIPVPIPEDASLDSIVSGQMLVKLKTDWSLPGHTYRQGSLVSIGFKRFLAGKRDFQVVFEPRPRQSVSTVTNSKSYLLIEVRDNVKSSLRRFALENGVWVARDPVALPKGGSAGVLTRSDLRDTLFFYYTDYITPYSIYRSHDGGATLHKVRSGPAFFDASGMRVVQHQAKSKDGTLIPYFAVLPRGFTANGKNPTLLTGYGGFGVSLVPNYSAVAGTSWVRDGGVYVEANIRGGGEFGPRWHLAAVKAHRQKAYDDFIAVAQDLIKRNVTSPAHLGIRGASNGGLLVGVALVQHPELFNAVVCENPLLDMKRYTKLGAGASWMAEYGNPDSGDWNYIRRYSPYQNVHEQTHYPRVLFTTSTRDDRVAPAHARKMAARMRKQGHDVLFYENTEGGHSEGANLDQAAYLEALIYAFLWAQLS